MKKYVFAAASFALAIFLIVITGEIAIRVYLHLRHAQNQSIINVTSDEELGWRPAPNYIFYGDKKDASGKKYSVNSLTDNNGFRIFGNPADTTKKKIFFLGDSFTHALEVSNLKTYYGILKNDLPVEVFAFGAGGYGTLQEYMILDKYLDTIRPDILIIQFSSNDFINNYYELELKSTWNNNGMQRPYLTGNGVIYKTPKKFPTLRNIINKHSLFLYYIFSRIDMLQAYQTHSVEEFIEKNGVSSPYFRDSIETTEQLIKAIKSRVTSSTLIYAFSVDDIEPYYDELRRILDKNGIPFIDGIPQFLKNAEQDGITTKAADKAHWNETGHTIVANVLEDYIIRANKDITPYRHTARLNKKS